MRDCGYTSPCWVWQRCKYPNGYGQASNKRCAHAVYYEREHGPVPTGMEIDHLCRNRACVNPDHLEAVPHPLNCHRGAKAKLDADDVRAIRRSAEPTRALAARFGVSVGHIGKLRAGRQWAGVA